MSALFSILFAVLILAAFAAWLLAVSSALKVWSMSPKGEKFGNYLRLGLLQFPYLEQRLGPSIQPTLRRYRLGLLGFFAFIIIAIVVSFIAATV